MSLPEVDESIAVLVNVVSDEVLEKLCHDLARKSVAEVARTLNISIDAERFKKVVNDVAQAILVDVEAALISDEVLKLRRVVEEKVRAIMEGIARDEEFLARLVTDSLRSTITTWLGSRKFSAAIKDKILDKISELKRDEVKRLAEEAKSLLRQNKERIIKQAIREIEPTIVKEVVYELTKPKNLRAIVDPIVAEARSAAMRKLKAMMNDLVEGLIERISDELSRRLEKEARDIAKQISNSIRSRIDQAVQSQS